MKEDLEELRIAYTFNIINCSSSMIMPSTGGFDIIGMTVSTTLELETRNTMQMRQIIMCLIFNLFQ